MRVKVKVKIKLCVTCCDATERQLAWEVKKMGGIKSYMLRVKVEVKIKLRVTSCV